MAHWRAEELVQFEKQVIKLFEEKKIRAPVHLCGGNEEKLIDFFRVIKKEDYVFSTHRNHYHYLLKGGDPDALLRELQGMEDGVCGGHARSMNICDPSINFYSSAIVGGSCAMAVGVAMALKKKKINANVWCFIGDGAEDTGHFVEASRFAFARALPIMFIIEDNDRSVDSTKAQRWNFYFGFRCPNVLKYEYTRTYPHVGIGKWIGM